jgi:hypothetical protein
MAFIVEMVRGKPYTPEYKFFSCGASQWKELLSIARTFGWNPLGTVHDTQSGYYDAEYVREFEPSYDPNDWRYAKYISDVDALGLTKALKLALTTIREGKVAVFKKPAPLLLGDEMSSEELLNVNQPSEKLLASFAQFVEGGGFVFAWDD